MGYIYKITNDVNGKMYIGKTELVDPEKRWKEHLADYKTRRCEKRPLYAAMNKYGEEHFYFEVIEETDNPNETCEREQYWINELRTYVGFDDCNGYNATLGGDGKSYLNFNEEEVIRYHTEEACYIIKRTANYYNVSLDTIKNILLKNKISYLGFKDVKRLIIYEELGGVLQIDINTKIILNIFENALEATLYLGKPKRSSQITCACNESRRKTHYAYGYLWYYGKDLDQAIKNGDLIENYIWF